MKLLVGISSIGLLAACGDGSEKEEVKGTDNSQYNTEKVETGTEEVVEEESTVNTTVDTEEDLEIEDHIASYDTSIEQVEGGYEISILGSEDEEGWSVTHIVKVNPSGEIEESKFNYVNSDGEYKTEQKEYREGAKKDITGTIKELNKTLDGVDVHTDLGNIEIEEPYEGSTLITDFEDTRSMIIDELKKLPKVD